MIENVLRSPEERHVHLGDIFLTPDSLVFVPYWCEDARDFFDEHRWPSYIYSSMEFLLTWSRSVTERAYTPPAIRTAREARDQDWGLSLAERKARHRDCLVVARDDITDAYLGGVLKINTRLGAFLFVRLRYVPPGPASRSVSVRHAFRAVGTWLQDYSQLPDVVPGEPREQSGPSPAALIDALKAGKAAEMSDSLLTELGRDRKYMKQLWVSYADHNQEDRLRMLSALRCLPATFLRGLLEAAKARGTVRLALLIAGLGLMAFGLACAAWLLYHPPLESSFNWTMVHAIAIGLWFVTLGLGSLMVLGSFRTSLRSHGRKVELKKSLRRSLADMM